MTNYGVRTLEPEEIEIYWNSLLHPYRSQMFTPNETANVDLNKNKFLDSFEERILSFIESGESIDTNNSIIRNLLESYLKDRTISLVFSQKLLKLGLDTYLTGLIYANKGTPMEYVMNSGASSRTLFGAIVHRKEDVIAYGREELRKFGMESPEVIQVPWMWKVLGWDPELERLMRVYSK
jgi:hypothetical protein